MLNSNMLHIIQLNVDGLKPIGKIIISRRSLFLVNLILLSVGFLKAKAVFIDNHKFPQQFLFPHLLLLKLFALIQNLSNKLHQHYYQFCLVIKYC